MPVPPPRIQGPPPGAPALRALSLCVTTAAASPEHIISLSCLTSLRLLQHFGEAAPLTVAQLTGLMGALATLPRLRKLDWHLDFPFEHSPGEAPLAEHGDGADPAAGSGAAEGAAVGAAAPLAGAPAEAAAAPGAPAAPPDWGWLHGFSALTDLILVFNPPAHLDFMSCAACHLAPWLGLAGWVGRMGRLERVAIESAGEEEAALRGAVPPGASYSTRRPYAAEEEESF